MPVSRPQSLHGIEFTAISSRRLAELSIATLGIYLFYWFYRNWQAVKKADKSRISPFWRALLAPFYSCSLFKRILESAQKIGYKGRYSPWLQTLIFMVLSLLAYDRGILDTSRRANYLFIIFGAVIYLPILPVQAAVNFYRAEQTGASPERTGFTPGEMLVVVFGIILAVSAVLSYCFYRYWRCKLFFIQV